ncbi:MAG: hypothetical protein Q9160_001970 [Pyrenula sp. 1 TL-2023]
MRLLRQAIPNQSHEGYGGALSTSPILVNVFFLHDSSSLKDTSLKILAWSSNFVILPTSSDEEEIEYPNYATENISKKLGEFLVQDLKVRLWPFEYSSPQDMVKILPTAQAILSSCTGINIFKGAQLPFGIQQVNKTGRKPFLNAVPFYVYKRCEVYRLQHGTREILTINTTTQGELSYRVLLDSSMSSIQDTFSGEDPLRLFCRHLIPALELVFAAETDLHNKVPFVHDAVAQRYRQAITLANISNLDSLLPICSDLDKIVRSRGAIGRKAAIRSLKVDLNGFVKYHEHTKAQQRAKEDDVKETASEEAVEQRADRSAPSTPKSNITLAGATTPKSAPLSARRLNPMAQPFTPTTTTFTSPAETAEAAKIRELHEAAEAVTEEAIAAVSYILAPRDFDAYGLHFCRFPNCNRLTLAIDETSLCCPWCGPFSWIRYCGPQHLVQDIFAHSSSGECGRCPLPGPVKMESLEKRHLRGLIGDDVGKGEGYTDRLWEISKALTREGWDWRWKDERE